jgi:hypothetical protein
MYHTISNIESAINLLQYIDNRDGNKRIGLKSLTYGVGWYNIINEYIQQTGQRRIEIPDGYYSFQQIVNIFQNNNITLTVNETNGIPSLISTHEVKISKGLREMLGFDGKRRFEANETHNGIKNVDLAIYKSLYIHLEQLNTSQNYLNGMPSTLLAVIPIENKDFGDITTVRFEHPEYKSLINDTISELTLEIRDEKNNKIINHLPTSCVLEII